MIFVFLPNFWLIVFSSFDVDGIGVAGFQLLSIMVFANCLYFVVVSDGCQGLGQWFDALVEGMLSTV
jgi:hypothetical protein